jgi:hypothetical protein
MGGCGGRHPGRGAGSVDRSSVRQQSGHVPACEPGGLPRRHCVRDLGIASTMLCAPESMVRVVIRRSATLTASAARTRRRSKEAMDSDRREPLTSPWRHFRGSPKAAAERPAQSAGASHCAYQGSRTCTRGNLSVGANGLETDGHQEALVRRLDRLWGSRGAARTGAPALASGQVPVAVFAR